MPALLGSYVAFTYWAGSGPHSWRSVPSGRLCGQVDGGYRLTIGALSLPEGYLISGAFPAAVNTNNPQRHRGTRLKFCQLGGGDGELGKARKSPLPPLLDVLISRVQNQVVVSRPWPGRSPGDGDTPVSVRGQATLVWLWRPNQISSQRPLASWQCRVTMPVAPRTFQRIPESLRHCPTRAVPPASMVPDPTTRTSP